MMSTCTSSTVKFEPFYVAALINGVRKCKGAGNDQAVCPELYMLVPAAALEVPGLHMLL